MPTARGRRTAGTYALYALALAREFWWTFAGVAAALAVGMLTFHLAPGARLDLGHAFYAAWMALLGQPVLDPPTWYVGTLQAVYPLIGFLLIGEGVVRFALIMMSRKRGEKEWTKVMISTYRNHVILCGLGHLGYRVLEQLVAARIPVVALEKDETCRFLAQARATRAPIVICDVKDDDALIAAGIEHARAIIIATNNDLANLEVALDARRMNPKIRIVMRLFDQQIAAKIGHHFEVDRAFSSSALAAPIVAAMSIEGNVLASYSLAGVPHMVVELPIDADSALAGATIRDAEARLHGRVVARTPAGATKPEPADGSSPPPELTIGVGDTLVVNAPAQQMIELVPASHG